MAFDGWNPFKKKPEVDPAAEAARQATLARRLKSGIAPVPESERGVLGKQMAERRDHEREVRVAKEHILGEFSLMQKKIERPDEYLDALSKILENHHATPEVARLVVTACKNELADFYSMHAGTDAIMGTKGAFQEARTGKKTEIHVVPEVFAVGVKLDAVGAMVNQMDEWGANWIKAHADNGSDNVIEFKMASGQ